MGFALFRCFQFQLTFSFFFGGGGGEKKKFFFALFFVPSIGRFLDFDEFLLSAVSISVFFGS